MENFARGHWGNLGIMAAACGVTVTSLLLMKEMARRILLLGALLWVALAGTGGSSPASGRRARAAVLGLGLGIAVIASYWLRWSVRFIGPDEWDFLCFYLNGQVAAHGLNFYDRGVFAEVFRQISIPYAFTPSRHVEPAPTPSSRIISVAVRPVYTASSLSILAGISALLPRQRPQAR